MPYLIPLTAFKFSFLHRFFSASRLWSTFSGPFSSVWLQCPAPWRFLLFHLRMLMPFITTFPKFCFCAALDTCLSCLNSMGRTTEAAAAAVSDHVANSIPARQSNRHYRTANKLLHCFAVWLIVWVGAGAALIHDKKTTQLTTQFWVPLSMGRTKTH